MVKSKLITNNFTIHSHDIFNKKNDENIDSFLMDMIMILFASLIIGNFLEGFEGYLRRHINDTDDDHAYDIFDPTLWLEFD